MIDKKLTQDFMFLKEKGYDVVGLFLYGSQNYSLATDESDVDSKAIVLTPREDLILRKNPISLTLESPTGGQIDVKEITTMNNMFMKQNINFLEILFTDYYIIDNHYDYLVTELRNHRERIAKANPIKTLNSIIGMQKAKQSRLFKRVESTAKDYDKYGYSAKDLHHIVRLNEFVTRYINGESYKDCLVSKMPEYLISIKKGRFDVDKVNMMAEASISQTEDMVKEYANKHNCNVDEGISELLDKIAISAYY